jgi:dienelactone hydrolase
MDESNRFLEIVNFMGFDSFGPSGTEEAYEDKKLNQYLKREKVLSSTVHPTFESDLRVAIGYDRIKLKKIDFNPNFASQWPSYTDRKIEGILATYKSPDVTLESFFMRPENDPSKGLFVALHGLGSSAAKTLGIDETDYMDSIAYNMVREGYDVLVPRLPSNPTMAAAINMRLLMMDHQILGVNAKFVCDLIRAVAERRAYKQVLIYGMRFGGRLAEIVAHTCDEKISRIIVDGLELPWRGAIRDAALRSRMMAPHLFLYRTPFLAHSSYLDFLYHDATDRVYLLNRGSLERIERDIESFFDRETQFPGSSVILVERENPHAFTKLSDVLAIAEDKFDELKSFSLVKK